MAKFGIGQPVRRLEDQRLVTGQGRYTDDINLPGQAYLVVVRSPHAHATITSGASVPSGAAYTLSVSSLKRATSSAWAGATMGSSRRMSASGPRPMIARAATGWLRGLPTSRIAIRDVDIWYGHGTDGGTG